MTKKRKAKTEPHRPFQSDAGTPETTRHKRRSTMERLIETKAIGGDELRAADEIERVFRHLCSGLFSKTMRYSEPIGKAQSNRTPKWFSKAYKDRWTPWANKAGMRVSVCLSILIDGMSGKMVDRHYGWRNGTATGMLISGLRDYCIIAGWVTRGTEQDWQKKSAV